MAVARTQSEEAAPSQSALLFERAKRVMPGGNSRHTVFTAPHPIYAVRGEGAYLWDADGHRYLDMISNYSAAIHGHCYPPVVDALYAQAKQLGAVGLPTESEIVLAELLQKRVPSLERLRFVNSGTEAVMYAIRGARAFTGRSVIAKIEGAYHGGYDVAEASLAPQPEAWGDASAPNTVPMARGTPASLAGDVAILPMHDLEAAVKRIYGLGDRLAAIVIDPLMSRLAYAPFQKGYVSALAEAARKVGALLILDEVYCFRVGFHGAQGELGLKPDLTTLGKIIGGGIPIGAFGGRADVMAVWDPLGPPLAHHGGTFNANPLAMAAGLAAMEHLTPEVFAHLARLGDHMRSGIHSIFSDLKMQGCVLGGASLVGIIPHAVPYRSYRGMLEDTKGHEFTAKDLTRALKNRGLLISDRGVFVLSSVMTMADIDFALEMIRQSLAEVRGLAS